MATSALSIAWIGILPSPSLGTLAQSLLRITQSQNIQLRISQSQIIPKKLEIIQLRNSQSQIIQLQLRITQAQTIPQCIQLPNAQAQIIPQGIQLPIKQGIQLPGRSRDVKGLRGPPNPFTHGHRRNSQSQIIQLQPRIPQGIPQAQFLQLSFRSRRSTFRSSRSSSQINLLLISQANPMQASQIHMQVTQLNMPTIFQVLVTQTFIHLHTLILPILAMKAILVHTMPIIVLYENILRDMKAT